MNPRRSINTTLRRLLSFPNEIPSGVSVVRLHQVSELRFCDVLLVGLYYVFKLLCHDLQLIGIHVSFKYKI